jgi:hypothetical protein
VSKVKEYKKYKQRTGKGLNTTSTTLSSLGMVNNILSLRMRNLFQSKFVTNKLIVFHLKNVRMQCKQGQTCFHISGQQTNQCGGSELDSPRNLYLKMAKLITFSAW